MYLDVLYVFLCVVFVSDLICALCCLLQCVVCVSFGVFSVFICIKMVFFTCLLCVGFCIACL